MVVLRIKEDTVVSAQCYLIQSQPPLPKTIENKRLDNDDNTL